MARDAKLSVMLKQEIKEDMKRYADGMGMTESALASYIIGNWIFQQNTIQGKMMSTDLLKEIIEKSAGAGA